jgi:hypothetical protein
MKLFSKFLSRITKRPKPEVTVHDPEAVEPHDLDNPFFDEDVKERIGAAISNATRIR